MKKPRTKKSPAPTPAKVTGAELPNGTQKGPGPSLPPSDPDDLAARVKHLERQSAHVAHFLLSWAPEELVRDIAIDLLLDSSCETSPEFRAALLRERDRPPLVAIDADAVHRKPGPVAKERAGR